MSDPNSELVRRSSTEKPPSSLACSTLSSSFSRLPDEIIEQILRLTDPNSFASLVLLNSKWRTVSQQAHLYAHQLQLCGSNAHHKRQHHSSASVSADSSLAHLRRLFAREVKRNLFDAYLRPRITTVRLLSNSISSSSCPGGEGMQFHASPRGHHLLAYNSSRIYVVDTRAPKLAVKRELKILRRPAATCITDSGSLLAVLLTEMQVDLYDLGQAPPKRTQSIILDNSPRAIALSPCGSVLAAAYEGGIEVLSLAAPGATASERRSVKCDPVDTLAFSSDGTQILGTTVQSALPNTVILTAPYYDPGSHMDTDDMSGLWTTSILFPNTSRDCSHAVLLQDSGCEEAAWAFAYDRSFETFRAVRIDDLRNGTTYFTGPVPNQPGRLLPCTLPAASYHGDLVAAGFQGNDIWVYGVPEDLDAAPDPPAKDADRGSPDALGRRSSGPTTRSASASREKHGDEDRLPQWQLLCDKLRNTFVAGSRVAELSGVGMVKWVADFGSSSLQERLVVAAKGLSPDKPTTTEEDDFGFADDGGRLLLIDFDYAVHDGQAAELTIEVGNHEPEVLEEETRDMETEVAIVRRRTVAQRRGNHHQGHLATRLPPLPPMPPPPQPMPRSTKGDDLDHDNDPLRPRRIGVLPQPPPLPPSDTKPRNPTPPSAAIAAAAAAIVDDDDDDDDGQSLLDAQEAFEDPYSQTGPRSGPTLRRAATAAANHRRFHPSGATNGPAQIRRVNGRQGPPDESDADNWVPPPPPYQKEQPVLDLPSFMRHPNIPPISSLAPRDDTTASSDPRNLPEPTASNELLAVSAVAVATAGGAHQRQPADSTLSRPCTRDATHPSPSLSGLGIRDNEDIYDVSPPGTPRPPALPPQSTDCSRPPTATVSSAILEAAEPSPMVSDSGYHEGTRQAPSEFTLSTVASTPAVQQGRRGGPPVLDLQIPPSTLSPGQLFRTHAPSAVSQVSPPTESGSVANSRTWPTSASATRYTPLSANSLGGSAHLPSATAVAIDGARNVSKPLPENPPAGLDLPPGQALRSRRQPYSPSQHPLQQNPISPVPPPAQPAAPPPDTPLIISTPNGISGAFDPLPNADAAPPTETPLIAPVPRHPLAAPGSREPGLRPAVERLEGMYSSASSAPRPAGLDVPPVPQSPAAASSRGILGRRKSRAGRSAARNMSDAKKRGWRRSKSKRGKKPPAAAAAAAADPSAEWTEISAPPLSGSVNAGTAASQTRRGVGRLTKREREQKCLVM